MKFDSKNLKALTAHWMIRENMWKPPVRISATLTKCGNKVYLFGGFSTVSLNDI